MANIKDQEWDDGKQNWSMPTGVSNLLASLGHTGRRVVLDHTLNTQTPMKTDEQKKKGFK